MLMQIGVPKESAELETRVAISPETVKKFKQKGFEVSVETGAGKNASFSDAEYAKQGALIVDCARALSSPIVIKINSPTPAEISAMTSGSWLIGMLEPYSADLSKLALAGINAISMELVPRTSRAQAMDVLSSQANIAGYRAVLEAVALYPRFFPMMMTSAGMARPAKLIVLGVGVAGLQAIATARRLGASVDAFDIRPEVKEQILSLGAKCIELQVNEVGTGSGGYAKELSAEGKAKQQIELTERLKKYDVIITTANIPGRRAPILVSEEAVLGMRPGSVIIDMAAPTGGNCVLTEPGKIIEKQGVKIVGITNFAALVASDSSQFYGSNVLALLDLLVQKKEDTLQWQVNFDDDIISATVVSYQGQVRFPQPKRI